MPIPVYGPTGAFLSSFPDLGTLWLAQQHRFTVLAVFFKPAGIPELKSGGHSVKG